MSAHGNFTGALRARAGDALPRDLARAGVAWLQRSFAGVGAHVARPGARGGALYAAPHDTSVAGDQDRERTIERAAGAPKICACLSRRWTHARGGPAYPGGRASSSLRQVAPGSHFDLRRPPGGVGARLDLDGARGRGRGATSAPACAVAGRVSPRRGAAGYGFGACPWGAGLRLRSVVRCAGARGRCA